MGLWGLPVEVVEAVLTEAELSNCVRGLPVAAAVKVVEHAGVGSVSVEIPLLVAPCFLIMRRSFISCLRLIDRERERDLTHRQLFWVPGGVLGVFREGREGMLISGDRRGPRSVVEVAYSDGQRDWGYAQ